MVVEKNNRGCGCGTHNRIAVAGCQTSMRLTAVAVIRTITSADIIIQHGRNINPLQGGIETLSQGLRFKFFCEVFLGKLFNFFSNILEAIENLKKVKIKCTCPASEFLLHNCRNNMKMKKCTFFFQI